MMTDERKAEVAAAIVTRHRIEARDATRRLAPLRKAAADALARHMVEGAEFPDAEFGTLVDAICAERRRASGGGYAKELNAALAARGDK